jgi:hypothetical protein
VAVDQYGVYYRNIAFYVVWALAVSSVFFLVRVIDYCLFLYLLVELFLILSVSLLLFLPSSLSSYSWQEINCVIVYVLYSLFFPFSISLFLFLPLLLLLSSSLPYTPSISHPSSHSHFLIFRVIFTAGTF